MMQSLKDKVFPARNPDSLTLTFHPIMRLGRTTLAVQGSFSPRVIGPSISASWFRAMFAHQPDRVKQFDLSVIKQCLLVLKGWDNSLRAVTVYAEVEIGMGVLQDPFSTAYLLELVRQSDLRISPGDKPFPRLVLVLGRSCQNFWRDKQVMTSLEQLKNAGVGMAVSYLPYRADAEPLEQWLRGNLLWEYLKLHASFSRRVAAADFEALAQLDRYLDWTREIEARLVLTGVKSDGILSLIDQQVKDLAGEQVAFQIPLPAEESSLRSRTCRLFEYQQRLKPVVEQYPAPGR